MRRALVFWFTGLSRAGKSTIAAAAGTALRRAGTPVLVLDAADVGESGPPVVRLCEQSRASCDVILVATVSPAAAARAAVRSALAPGFYEVHCTAGLDVVARRDTRDLAVVAAPDAVIDLARYSLGTRYEPPANPDLKLDTAGGDPALATARLLTFVRARLARHPAAVALRDGTGLRNR